MADRPKEGYSDGSDDGGNKTLRGFVLIRKSHGEKNGSMFAEHSRFNCMYVRTCRNSYVGPNLLAEVGRMGVYTCMYII